MKKQRIFRSVDRQGNCIDVLVDADYEPDYHALIDARMMVALAGAESATKYRKQLGLCDRKIEAIRKAYRDGQTAVALAKKYGVSNSLIRRICDGARLQK